MYKYDDADELLEEVYGNKYKMEYAYDGMQERKYDKYTDLSTNESLRYNYDYTPWGAFSNRTMGTGNPEVFRFGTRAEECGRDNNGNIEDHLYYDYDWGTVKQYDYTYDAFNRMITSSIGGVTTTYAYNGDNLRQSKTTNGVTTSHVYDGSDIVYEKKGSDTYVYIRGLELIASKKNDGEFEYYHHDVHGSVIAKTNSNGQTDVYEYDAFGNMESTSTTDTENPFKYCGEYVDEETGFVYLRNRYYDPSIGCFTTIDPAMDGDNWYAYCANNPVNGIDPLGLWMNGDEKLSVGAQSYTKYYGDMWSEANSNYMNYSESNPEMASQALNRMNELHDLAENIRNLDINGDVSGTILGVPLYCQKNTYPNGDNNQLCWATSQAMIASYYLNDNIDRTQSIASYTRANIEYFWGYPISYNEPFKWVSSDRLNIGIDKRQVQEPGMISFMNIEKTIDSGDPFGVLYRNSSSGHWKVGIGYASAKGHSPLVVSNDPWNGTQNIQSYDDFQNLPDGRSWTYTARVK